MIDRAFLKSITPLYKAYQLYRYLAFQPRLAGANFKDWRARSRPDSVSLPPAKLRYRVHGALDRASFLSVGHTVAQNLRDVLITSVGRDFDSFHKILDFGCGSGRVIRNLIPDAASHGRELFATDIDPELVLWCRDNLPGVHWHTNAPRPPLDYRSDTFDLVYAISVFTHLDESYQLAWLRELARITQPGGILVLTVIGEHVYQALAPSEQQQLRSRGFLFLQGPTGRMKLDGLPDFYQTAYHTREYIDRVWSDYFEVVRYVERGINDHQDAVVLRKRPS